MGGEPPRRGVAAVPRISPATPSRLHHEFRLSVPVHPGQAVEFSYPSDNRFRVTTRLRRRRFIVQAVRDFEREPVEKWAVELRPDLRRGRFLLIGEDLELHRPRSFYLSSARSVRDFDVPLFRIGLYDPLDESKPVQFCGPVWTDLRADRARVRQVIEEYNRQVRSSRLRLSAGVFPVYGVDLRVTA